MNRIETTITNNAINQFKIAMAVASEERKDEFSTSLLCGTGTGPVTLAEHAIYAKEQRCRVGVHGIN